MKTPNKKTPDKNAQATAVIDRARNLASKGQLSEAIAALAAIEKSHRKTPGYRASWPVIIFRQATPSVPPATAIGRWRPRAAGHPPISLKSGSRPRYASAGPSRPKNWPCKDFKCTVTAPGCIIY